MTTLEAQCPHCQARFRLPADQAGKPARCGRCQQTFTPPAAALVAPVPLAARPATPKATVRVLNAEPVPAPPRPAPATARPSAPARVVNEEPEPKPKFKRRPDSRSRDRNRRVAKSGIPVPLLAGGLIGGGLFLLAAAGLGAYMISGSSSTPTVTQTAAVQPSVPSLDSPTPQAAPSVEATQSLAQPVSFGPPPGPPLSPKEAIRHVKASAVYIRCDMGRNQLAMGSGFFAGQTGYIITNAHVIGYGPKSIHKPNKVQVVIDSNGPKQRVLDAKIIGLDADEDLALLHVDGADLPPPLPFGRAADLVETQEVVIFGYPLGEVLGKDISVNQTTVSSLRKENGAIAIVQVAGGMAPGNSGGPVTNRQGEVIGVSVAGITGTQINFAIPAEKAETFARGQFASGGQMKLGKLSGVRPTTVMPSNTTAGGQSSSRSRLRRRPLRPPGFPR